MQFSREHEPVNAIRRYDAEAVWIRDEKHEGSLAIGPVRLYPEFKVSTIDDIDQAALAPLLAEQPEVIVLGVGDVVQFPDAATLRAVQHAGVGIEVMNDGAAVRTYNVLLSEDRAVILALVR